MPSYRRTSIRSPPEPGKRNEIRESVSAAHAILPGTSALKIGVRLMKSKKTKDSVFNRRDIFRAGALAGTANWLAPTSAGAPATLPVRAGRGEVYSSLGVKP